MNNARDELGRIAKQYNKYDLSGEYGIGWTNKGEEFWFDKEDYDKIKNYCWHFNRWGHLISTERGSNKRVFLHRLVMQPIPDGLVVDHKNHPKGRENKIDNRKQNLEIKTTQQNCMNIHNHKNNKSGCSGVTERNSKWIARIGYMNKRYSLGTYDKLEDAIKARKEAEKMYYGRYSFDSCNK